MNVFGSPHNGGLNAEKGKKETSQVVAVRLENYPAHFPWTGITRVQKTTGIHAEGRGRGRRSGTGDRRRVKIEATRKKRGGHPKKKAGGKENIGQKKSLEKVPIKSRLKLGCGEMFKKKTNERRTGQSCTFVQEKAQHSSNTPE